jgi:hypothetical protein
VQDIEDAATKEGVSEEEKTKRITAYVTEATVRQQEKAKKVNEKFSKLVDADAEKFSAHKTTPVKGIGAQALLTQLAGSTIDKELTAGRSFTKVTESIGFSAFNPVPPSRRLAGDVFYLVVRTLDAGEKHVTCSASGFYLNDSAGGHFAPGPSSTQKAQAYTLVSLLNQISPCFGKQLQTYLNELLTTEQYLLMQPVLPAHSW